MRYYEMSFGLICPKNTTEGTMDSFEDDLVELVEKYGFSLGSSENFKAYSRGGLIEVDENGNRV